MSHRSLPPDPSPSPITPADTARYTAELLDSLRKMALKQEQVMLAHFLELAAVEARAQVNLYAHDTRLPE
jgi:hypothetical protein